MNNEVSKITEQYLAKGAVNYLLSPTLFELFRDYTPKFIKGNLVWIKKPKDERRDNKLPTL